MAQHAARVLPILPRTLDRVWLGAVSADRIVLPANDAAVFEVV